MLNNNNDADCWEMVVFSAAKFNIEMVFDKRQLVLLIYLIFYSAREEETTLLLSFPKRELVLSKVVQLYLYGVGKLLIFFS